ncbi:hypothetical protein E4K72_15285 [Oxalobacteraceae bacterium OM1]|nr:hypothetical protein E4K72_15285 [Oxalobacteraceae bacterium OM1]
MMVVDAANARCSACSTRLFDREQKELGLEINDLSECSIARSTQQVSISKPLFFKVFLNARDALLTGDVRHALLTRCGVRQHTGWVGSL